MRKYGKTECVEEIAENRVSDRPKLGRPRKVGVLTRPGNEIGMREAR
jgi:hypothetical protein